MSGCLLGGYFRTNREVYSAHFVGPLVNVSGRFCRPSGCILGGTSISRRSQGRFTAFCRAVGEIFQGDSVGIDANIGGVFRADRGGRLVNFLLGPSEDVSGDLSVVGRFQGGLVIDCRGGSRPSGLLRAACRSCRGIFGGTFATVGRHSTIFSDHWGMLWLIWSIRAYFEGCISIVGATVAHRRKCRLRQSVRV